MISNYEDSKYEIKDNENQREFEINKFNCIIKLNILEKEKNCKFDNQDSLQTLGFKETQAANQAHENYSKTFKNNLDVRFDVMNKNFIRAVKRELKCIYSEYLKNKGCRNSKSSPVSNNELFV